MYVMTNSGNLFSDELTKRLIEAGFIKSQCKMSIYYKYSPYGTNIVLYLMLIIVSIAILLKVLENDLWTL